VKKSTVKYLIGVAALVLVTTANAKEIDETVDAASDGHVDIVNISGSVEVFGWSKSSVEVTGDLGEKVEELILERNGDKVLVKVKVPRNNSSNISSDLTIRVPAGSSIDVSTVSADITSEGVGGEQNLHTVSGDVEAEAAASDVAAESVSGDVDVTGDGSDIETEANTVSGDVTVIGVSGAVVVEAVSGDLLVRDGSFERATLNSVNGDVDFQAGLRDGGKLVIETVNGEVDVQFGGDVSAKFDIETFNGDIDNCFGPKAERTSKYTPGWELSFTVGDGDGRVTITTLNGDVDICN
jgi:putative adhesin